MSPGVCLSADEVDSLVLVCLSGALAFTTILSVLLAVLLCVTNKRNKCKCTGTVSAAVCSLTVCTNLSWYDTKSTFHSVSDSRVRFSAPSTTNAEVCFSLLTFRLFSLTVLYDIVIYCFIFYYQGDQNEENIHYAALREHKSNRPRRQRNNGNTECVYSSVKH